MGALTIGREGCRGSRGYREVSNARARGTNRPIAEPPAASISKNRTLPYPTDLVPCSESLGIYGLFRVFVAGCPAPGTVHKPRVTGSSPVAATFRPCKGLRPFDRPGHTPGDFRLGDARGDGDGCCRRVSGSVMRFGRRVRYLFFCVAGVVVCSLVWVELERRFEPVVLPPFEPPPFQPTTRPDSPESAGHPD
jgi:hypothetical protein